MKKLIVAIVIVVMGIGANINAQPAGQMPVKRGDNFVPGQMIKTRLNLTDEQEQKFDEIMFAQRERAIDTRAEVQKLRLEVNKIVASGNVDVEKVKTLQGKIADLRKSQMESRLNAWEKVNKILTPEQQKVWAKMLLKFNGRKGKARRGMRCRRFMGKRMMMMN
jgi:Spy/CpxP family protein refolding chaperone